MSTTDGDIANANTFNTSYMDSEVDTGTLGRVDLMNNLAASGANIINLQRNVNAIASALGIPTNQVYNYLVTWANTVVGSASSDVVDKIEALVERFTNATGHDHSGADGEGPKVSALDLADTNLRGVMVQGTDLVAVTGINTDISAQLVLASPSTNTTTEGVVVNNPYNRIILRNSVDDQAFEDATGNEVYGRLTESAGTWTLSYYSEIAGVETVYTFSSSGVRLYYQVLFPVIGPTTPVYSTEMFIPSSNLTADVIDASATHRGVVTTGTQSFAGLKTFLTGLIAQTEFGLGHIVNSALTGADQDLTYANPITALTNASLTSVRSIAASAVGRVVMLFNNTGGSVTLKNEDAGATAGNRIVTGTGGNVTMLTGSSTMLLYSTSSNRWQIVGSVPAGASSAITSLTNDVTASGPGAAAATIANDAVTNAKAANMVTQTIKGRTTAGTGDPEDLTATQATAILNAMVGDSGSGGTKGLAPAPATGDAAASKFLKADGTWATPAGGGSGTVTTLRYFSDDSLTIPGGVTSVRVTSKKKLQTMGRGFDAQNSIAKDHYGDIYSWGFNAFGQVGDGTTVDKSSPILVVGGLIAIKVFNTSAGSYLLDKDGQCYSFGENSYGLIGDATQVQRSSPVLVAGPVKKFVKIDGDYGSAIAMGLTPRGKLYGWGRNTAGQLGVGSVLDKSSPTLVLGGITFVDFSVTAGQYVLALSVDGDMYGFGNNTNGSLGVGDIVDRSSPVIVVGGFKYKQLSVHHNSDAIFGLAVNGDLYGWGVNSSGKLGTGNVLNTSSPTLVVGGYKFVKAFAGNTGSFAIRDNGDLYAWGANNQGRLGVGDTTNRSSPTLVVGGYKFVKVFPSTANFSTSFGLTADGDLYAWGSNANGEIGDGTVVVKSSPTLVVGGYKWADLILNAGACLGVTTEGRLYAWGNNLTGQLGVGDTNPRSSPTLVLGSLFLDVDTQAESQDIMVTPAGVYAIKFGLANSYFGGRVVGKGEIEFIEVTYVS